MLTQSHPLLDRYMKYVRKMRDSEEKLMKDVPGWEVGTWYGEPLFKTVPDDYWYDPTLLEFYTHANIRHFEKRAYFDLML